MRDVITGLTAAVQEIYGLFVEDGSYAAAIAAWLFVAALAFPHFSALGEWRAPLMFAGLVVILVENVLRTARR